MEIEKGIESGWFNLVSVQDIEFKWRNEWSSSIYNMWEKPFFIPWYGRMWFNIQSISNDTLAHIFKERYLLHQTIPSRNEIIEVESQTEYFKTIKSEVKNRLFWDQRFCILSWPTQTWKTTLIKTIWYEAWIPVYEDIWDADKVLWSFLEEKKTLSRWNVPQVKTIPWLLMKALCQWWIYLINEANLLSIDTQISLANLIENWFFIFNWKKYKIHPNFALAFTSNEWYAWLKEYNSAIVRKSWWLVEFGYEKDLNEEIKIINTIYSKKILKCWSNRKISNKDLEKICWVVRDIRTTLERAYLEGNHVSRFYSEDFSPFYHNFYIRLYDNIISYLLSSTESSYSMVVLIMKFIPRLQSRAEYYNWVDYISFKNDINAFNNLILNKCNALMVYVESDRNTDNDEKRITDPFILKLMERNWLSDQSPKCPNNTGETRKLEKQFVSFSMDLFRNTLWREVKANWNELKRTEHIEQISQDFYQRLIYTNRNHSIIIQWFYEEKYLKLLIDNNVFYVTSENDKTLKYLNEICKKGSMDSIQDDLELLGDIDVYFQDDSWDDVLEIDWKQWYYIKLKSIFSSPKQYEIRRRSKLCIIEKQWKKYVILLWFKWGIKDVRYQNDRWIFFIPQSKVSDVVMTIYEIWWDIPNQGHFLSIDKDNKLSLNTKDNYDIQLSPLSKLSNQSDIYDSISMEIKTKFANLDKLNLHDWWLEREYTALPNIILWTQVDLQSLMFDDHNWRKLPHITETTEKIIYDMWVAYLWGKDVLLTWPSWSWKTSIAKEFAKRYELPYISIQIPEDFAETHIKWWYEWNEWEVENVMRPFLNYYVNWWVCEMKEINMATLTAFLNAYMDENWVIMFNWNSYRRHPNFIIIATRNPINMSLYPWTNPMNTSSLWRFVPIYVDHLPKDEFLEVVMYVAEHENNSLIQDVWSIDNLRMLLKWVYDWIIYPIRSNIDKLIDEQDNSTSEQLVLLSKKNITIDILISFIRISKSRAQFIKELKLFMEFTDQQRLIVDISLLRSLDVIIDWFIV